MKKTGGLSRAVAAAALGLLLVVVSSVAFAQTPVPADQSSSAQATVQAPAMLTVTGQVTNGTPGGSLPVTMTVSLYAVDGQAVAFTKQGTADPSGKVHFDNVAFEPGRSYALGVVEGTTQYQSELVPPKDGEKTLTVPIQIYDTTTDTSRLRIDQMFAVGQFVNEQELEITNAYLLSNEGDRTVEGGEKTADGQPATLRFYLPAGANKVEFQGDDGKNFFRTEDGFVTNWGVPPGRNSAQVVMRYTLPYTGQLHLETRAPYPVQKVSVLVDPGITVTGSLGTSSSLVDLGTQTGQDGVVRRAYSGDGLATGKSLTLNLSGRPQASSPAPAPVSTAESASPAVPARPATEVDRRLMGAGVLAVGLLAILAACVWRLIALRPRASSETGEHRALYEAIADLDEDHQAGMIGEPDYADQRAFLKAALLAALQDPGEAVESVTEGQA